MERDKSLIEVDSRRDRIATFIQTNLQPTKQLLEEGRLDDVDQDISSEAQNFEIREYQLDAWGELWDARQAGRKKALIHLATGLGKTSVGVFDVIKFREEFQEQNHRLPRILFTSHQDEINNQAAERFKAFIPGATQGFYNGDKKNRDADITFGTLQSLYGSLDTFKPDYFDYIIYDEAHHGKAETFETVIKYFKPRFQLALTGTPNRLDGLDIRELFGKELYSKGLAEALAEGLLADPDYHIVFDTAVKEAMQSGFEPTSLKELLKLFSLKPRNEVIAQNIKDEMTRLGLEFGTVKTLVFCQNIEHTEEMAEMLGGRSYHSDLDKKKRTATLLDFRNNVFQVMVTRDMVNEGVDIPDAMLLVFLRSTSSPTIFEQQLGRGLRKHPGKGKVFILDFVANVERIAMVRELAHKVQSLKPIQRDSVAQNSNESRPINDFDSSGATTPDGGFKIHTNHVEFDFDKLAVNLLEKYGLLKASSGGFGEVDNETLVALALSLSPDKPITRDYINDLSKSDLFPSASTIGKRFGSIRQFQRACGFDARIADFNLSDIDNESLIEMALQLSPDAPLAVNRITDLSKKGKFVSGTAIINRFGSMQAFREACGFISKPTRFKTDDEIAKLANEIAPGRSLSVVEMNKFSRTGKFVGGTTIIKRFGSIDNFNKARGLPVSNKVRLDSKSLTSGEIVELALGIKPDTPLTQEEVRKLSKEGRFVSTSVIKYRFGSFTDFRRACGFEVKERLNTKSMTNEDIILLARSLKPEEVITSGEMIILSEEGSFVSPATITSRFGSIKEFQRACGFKV